MKHIHVHLHSTRDAFEEGKHPRSHGQFTTKGGGSTGSSKKTTTPAKSSPGPKASTPAKPATNVAELHKKHEEVAKSMVAEAKRDPFLGKYASYGSDYGGDLLNRKNPDGSVELSIRDLGQWVNPPGKQDEEDYDWQVPTEKTKKAIGDFVNRMEQRHNVKIDVAGSEKNYLDFHIKPK